VPRVQIDLPNRIDYLSVLDQDGNVDQDLAPDLDDELLLKLHRAMLLGRRFDERMLRLQRQGRIGTFAPIKGQEAAQLGPVANLRPDDWLVPAFRETAAMLWRGQSMESVLLFYGGYNHGAGVPAEIKNLPVAVPVGTQTLHAVGLAYASKYQGQNIVALTFLGDGATSEGDFHEALNFAGVFQLPVIFVCQNNQWAISVPRSHQTHSRTLAQKALGYGLPGIQVDGNDILAMYAASQEAVERARAGEGATLIEAVTYRMSMHTTADDPTRYRSDEEVEEWEARDPITRFQTYLKDKDLLSDERVEELEEEIKNAIAEAVQQAERRMEELDDPMFMFDHMYAEIPPYLQEQKEQFAREYKGGEGGSRG
jgi:pyruvate dehydrogenase E1 component alpha subunit